MQQEKLQLNKSQKIRLVIATIFQVPTLAILISPLFINYRFEHHAILLAAIPMFLASFLTLDTYKKNPNYKRNIVIGFCFMVPIIILMYFGLNERSNLLSLYQISNRYKYGIFFLFFTFMLHHVYDVCLQLKR